MTNMYHAFLLRCWQEGALNTNTLSAWRFSLEDVDSHQRRGFASIEELVAFLEANLAAAGSEKSERQGLRD